METNYSTVARHEGVRIMPSDRLVNLSQTLAGCAALSGLAEYHQGNRLVYI